MRPFVAMLALSLVSCATAQIAVRPEDMAATQRTLEHEDLFLRVSCYVTPFFGDATKKFLSPTDPHYVELVTNPDGTPIEPGQFESIAPAGTRVRVTKVEFPTAYVMAERVLYTPRTLAWLYLVLATSPKNAPPHVLVLRPGIKDAAELNAEIDRLITRNDPTKTLEAFSDATREAIRLKKAAVDMPAEALEMALGPPERKQFTLEGTTKRETWTWGGGKRVAVLLDGRVSELR